MIAHHCLDLGISMLLALLAAIRDGRGGPMSMQAEDLPNPLVTLENLPWVARFYKGESSLCCSRLYQKKGTVLGTDQALASMLALKIHRDPVATISSNND